jgi:hypothetical protein
MTGSTSPNSRKKGKAAQRAAARERIAAARERERRRGRRRRLLMWTISGAVVAVIAGLVTWAVIAQKSSDHKAQRAATSPRATLPPWSVPANTVQRAQAAGLTVAGMEGSAEHFHAHLDLIVNGQPIQVPAQLGIDPSGASLAEMHTHDTTGVIHIESPSTHKHYTLRQLFDEWGVKLDATSLGGLRTDAGHTLTAYVNGSRRAGDPGAIPLTAHEEIALVYGPSAATPKVPSSYAFPSGE